MGLADFSQLGGWVPDPKGVELVQSELPFPVFGDADPVKQLAKDYEKVDTHLWRPLVELQPNYRRGAQGIGSCVAWGAEIVQTMLCAKWWYRNGLPFIAEVATEPNYGLCRVEALGKTRGGWSDGAFGGAMAKAARNYGCVLRLDHSLTTGNAEHNLLKYSSKKEKDWGNYGCGGQNDNSHLDTIAKEHPVKEVAKMSGFEDLAVAMAGGAWGATIASMYGTDMRRNQYGECRWNKSWAHQMGVVGIRFGSRPAAQIAQSWGPNTCTGPSGDEYTENLPPGGTPANILGFTFWMPAEDFDKVCKSGDCWVYADVQGFKIPQTSFVKESRKEHYNDWWMRRSNA